MSRHSAPPDTDRAFRLLFVCTGNICRSPFAEILSRHLLIGRLGGREAAAFEVTSAGVQAVADAGMHPDSRDQLAPWGLDRVVASRFVARQLRSAMVEDADLILGAAPQHRSAVVERSPAGLPKTFSLREFARLAASVDVAALPEHPVRRAHALVHLTRRQRGLLPPVEPDADGVPDPIGGSAEDHHRTAVLIRDAVSAIIDAIAPARPPVGPLRRAAAPSVAARPAVPPILGPPAHRWSGPPLPGPSPRPPGCTSQHAG